MSRWQFAFPQQTGRHRREELATQLFEQLGSDPWGIAARDECALHDLEGASRITLRQCYDQLVDQRAVVVNDT